MKNWNLSHIVINIQARNGVLIRLYQIDRIPKVPASSKAERDCFSQIKHSKFYNDSRKQHNVLYNEQEKETTTIYHQ